MPELFKLFLERENDKKFTYLDKKNKKKKN